jgi:ferrous iron transport protein A
VTAAVSFQGLPIRLDHLELGAKAFVQSIDWDSLDRAEANRLKHFGFDEGVAVEALHVGPFGRDPIAIRVGRMTVAIRRRHAGAVQVVPLEQ